MEFLNYFTPIYFENESFKNNSLGQKINFHTDSEGFPDLENIDIALIGVPEERGARENVGCAETPNSVRKHIYNLFHRNHKVNIADLGNLKIGSTLQDTYYALKEIIAYLIENKIIPVIIGGSHDLTYGNYLAYEKLEQVINLTVIDNQFNLGEANEEINSASFLSKIILHQPNFLFNYSNIGYQTYFIDQNAVDLMTKLNYDIHRLGEISADIKQLEPVIRNADLVSFDISAIRQSDAMGNLYATPNGMYAEQACQLSWYAGISEKLTSIGFYETNPSFDNRDQTSQLVAQLIWHFIDGFYNRTNEFPTKNQEDFINYRLVLDNHDHELFFIKSKKTDRWWIKIPYPSNKGIKYERHQTIPCTYDDYKTACNNEMPEIWIKTYQKLI